MFKSQQFIETKYDKEAWRGVGEVSTLTAQQTHFLWMLHNSSLNQEQENGGVLTAHLHVLSFHH